MTTADNLPRLYGRLDRYTSVGGYPLLYVTDAGDEFCPDCANDLEADLGRPFPGVADVNWENPDLFCDGCGERIESAYAEPEDA